ncbi:MAG TPA: response regulator transcription factor [Thermoanaerobaculia bacterium]|nr:response regulator transcription factor [Thermoanaerobaculia bacterium]
MRILIADDHAIVREGLKTILSREHDMEVGAEAANSEEALRLALDENFDVVILDVFMPGNGGLETLGRLRKERPELPVLVLSVHPEDDLALQALRSGASGYLNKDAACEQLVGAVRKVVSGGHYISESLAEKLALGLTLEPARPLAELLSDREYDVLRRLASGRTVSGVAEDLGLSVKTISTVRSRVLRKLHLQNTAELIRYAIGQGLVD